MMSDIFNLNVNQLTVAGNVGIGTSSPSAKLEVNSGTSTGPTLRLATTGITVSSNTEIGTLDFYNSDATAPGARTASYISSYSAGTAGGGDLRFATSENANTVTERMRITAAGNVGIGTSAPSAPLHVVGGSASGTSYDVAVITAGSSNTAGSGAKLYLSGTPTSPTTRAAMIEGVITGVTNAHSMLFYTSASGGSPTERLRITSTGNVGIGTSSPDLSAILDVQSTTKGVRMPNMTTTEKNAIASPAAGLMVYDTTLAKLCVYTTAWETITSL
jgi:hypothetical protein